VPSPHPLARDVGLNAEKFDASRLEKIRFPRVFAVFSYGFPPDKKKRKLSVGRAFQQQDPNIRLKNRISFWSLIDELSEYCYSFVIT
jgi:hypothetical protein